MSEAPAKRYISTQQAAFIGVAAMVGAGIFSLLGAAGEVAGAAVWLSFLLAGGIAALQGYSFAKLGARYPSAGGLLEYVVRGFGDGHFGQVRPRLSAKSVTKPTPMNVILAADIVGTANVVAVNTGQGQPIGAFEAGRRTEEIEKVAFEGSYAKSPIASSVQT